MAAGAPIGMRIKHIRLEQIYSVIYVAHYHKVKTDGTKKYSVVNLILKHGFYTLHNNRSRATFLHFSLTISTKILTSPIN
jgi:hypothetical protein